MVKVVQNLVPKSKYNIKCPYEMVPIGITVHNTANDASARNEINYMISNDNEVSFHYAVDDKEAVQGLPLNRNGWHAGDSNGPGNRKTIGIEICYSKSGGDRFTKAEENAAELIAMLLQEYGWDTSVVKRHGDYDPSGKDCPHRTNLEGWDRFLNMVKNKLGNEEEDIVPSNVVNVFYRVKTKKYGWLPEVKNLEDYAGWKNSPITDVAIKVDKGSIWYQVHVKGGKWLPKVTGYNINDYNNGYAGNGKIIDAIRVYYNTPDNIRPYKKAKYKVNNYPYQYDNETTNGQDGYAGVYGVNVTKFQIIIE